MSCISYCPNTYLVDHGLAFPGLKICQATKINNKKTPASQGVKQLANIIRQATKQPKKRRTVKRLNRGPRSVVSTQVPVEIAYSVRQMAPLNKIHTERASEYIGTISASSNTPANTTIIFRMNPITLAGTRLQTLAGIYQKFRFRKLRLVVQTGASTSISGLYVAGYNSNPDSEIAVNSPKAGTQVFALPGAVSRPLWIVGNVDAKIEDRNKWYYVDPDSEEVMNTTQGYFAIVIQAVPSTITPIVLPILLEYEVEFTGSAIQLDNNTAPVVFPAGSWALNGVTGNWTFTALAGEPAVPTIPSGSSWIINPVYEIPLSTSDPALCSVITGTTLSWIFYEDIESQQNGSAIKADTNFTTARTTWQRIIPN